MVGTLFSVGLKKISLPDIDYMLNYPSKDCWNENADVPSGCGLYLFSVNYNPSDMILTDDNQIVEVTDVLPNEESESNLDEEESVYN